MHFSYLCSHARLKTKQKPTWFHSEKYTIHLTQLNFECNLYKIEFTSLGIADYLLDMEETELGQIDREAKYISYYVLALLQAITT